MMDGSSPNHKIGFTMVRNHPDVTPQAQGGASDRHALPFGKAQKPLHTRGAWPQSAPSVATWPVCISRICISDKQPDVAFSSTQKCNRLMGRCIGGAPERTADLQRTDTNNSRDILLQFPERFVPLPVKQFIAFAPPDGDIGTDVHKRRNLDVQG